MFETLTRKICDIVCSRPKVLLFLVLTLTILSTAYTAKYLKFNPDRNSLISEKKTYNKRFLRLIDEFGTQDNHIIVFESGNSAKLIGAAEETANRLKTEPTLIKNVFFKFDKSAFEEKGLFYLKEEDLLKVKGDLLNTGRNFNPSTNVSTFENIFMEYDNSLAGGSGYDKKRSGNEARELEYLVNLIRDMRKSLQPGSFELEASQQQNALFPEGAGFHSSNESFNAPGGTHYNSFDNGKILLMEIEVNDREGLLTAAGSTNFIRKQIEETKKMFQEVNIGLTGAVTLEADEMEVSQKEMFYISIGALVAISIFFIISFNSILMPLIGISALLCSISWTFGFTTLAIGHLNLFSIVFAVVLIGLGIDFSIHLILRYSENRNLDMDKRDALFHSLAKTGKGIILGAVTTAISFYSALLIDFQGLRELGLIAGTGILFALFSTLLVLPSLIIIFDRSLAFNKHFFPIKLTSIKIIINRFFVSNRSYLAIVAIVFAVISFFFIKDIKFDDNLMNLLPPNLESTEYAKKIVKSTGTATWYGAVITDSQEESNTLSEKLTGLKSVGKVESLASALPQEQEKKAKIVKEIKDIALAMNIPNNLDTTINYLKLEKILEGITGKLDIARKQGVLKAGIHPMIDQQIRLHDEINAFLLLAKILPPKEVEEKLSRNVGANLNGLKILKNKVVPEPVTSNDLPQAMKDRFIGKTGKNLVYIFPQEDIWEEGKLGEFVSDVREICPEATGAPFQVHDTNRLIKKGFLISGLFTMIIIFIILFINYRNIFLTLGTLYPLFLTVLWTIGLMKLFHLQPNPANVIAFPLILGISIDNSIHTMLRIKEGKSSWVHQTSTGKAIFVSSVTTIIGFGSLALSSHRGLSSLGLILFISLSCSLATSIIILPATRSLIQAFVKKQKTGRRLLAQSA
ncbi:MAG: MMPL family transporter [Candidatus Brocadiaceae bacterium]|nr:MMPL family transporter [Candidatus Brocadiaceae bacterium]